LGADIEIQDAIVMLDERENAEGAEITRFHNLFRLHDDGDLKLAEFSESSRDAILEKAHARLVEASNYRARDAIRRHYSGRRSDFPQSSAKGTGAPLKPTHLPQPATEAARALQKKLGASAVYANRAVEEMTTDILERLLNRPQAVAAGVRDGVSESAIVSGNLPGGIPEGCSECHVH
jgi:hypothetical protein